MAILLTTVILLAGALGYFLPRGLLAAGARMGAHRQTHHPTVTALVVAVTALTLLLLALTLVSPLVQQITHALGGIGA